MYDNYVFVFCIEGFFFHQCTSSTVHVVFLAAPKMKGVIPSLPANFLKLIYFESFWLKNKPALLGGHFDVLEGTSSQMESFISTVLRGRGLRCIAWQPGTIGPDKNIYAI